MPLPGPREEGSGILQQSQEENIPFCGIGDLSFFERCTLGSSWVRCSKRGMTTTTMVNGSSYRGGLRQTRTFEMMLQGTACIVTGK